MLLEIFYDARRVSKTAWMVQMEMEGLKSASLEICKTIMRQNDLYRMSINLPRQAPKLKLANHGLKTRNGEVGIIKPWSYNTKLHYSIITP